MLKRGFNINVTPDEISKDTTEYKFKFMVEDLCAKYYGLKVNEHTTFEDIMKDYNESVDAPLKIVKVTKFTYNNDPAECSFSAIFETTKDMTPKEFIDLYSRCIDDDTYSFVVDIGFEVISIGRLTGIKYVQTTINYDGEYDEDKFSGNGGRSYVTLTSDSIDAWDTAEEAIENGKEYFRPSVRWGVYVMDMDSRRIIKCCYDSYK